MPSKETLIRKLFARPMPTNFTKRELDTLMKKCECNKEPGGRGSGVRYVHEKSGKVLEFDVPHPGKDLYKYHIKKVKGFLVDIEEVEE